MNECFSVYSRFMKEVSCYYLYYSSSKQLLHHQPRIRPTRYKSLQMFSVTVEMVVSKNIITKNLI